MDQTETMEVPPVAPAEERKGRGPTRPALRFADLLEEIRGDAAFLVALKAGTTAKQMREEIKRRRASIKEIEKWIAETELTADYLARAEELPEVLRRALVATLETDPK